MFLTELALLRKIVKTTANYQVEINYKYNANKMEKNMANIDIFSTGQQVDSLTTKLNMTTAYTQLVKFFLVCRSSFLATKIRFSLTLDMIYSYFQKDGITNCFTLT